MAERNRFSRRKFMAIGGAAALGLVIGCSKEEEGSLSRLKSSPLDTVTAKPSTTANPIIDRESATPAWTFEPIPEAPTKLSTPLLTETPKIPEIETEKAIVDLGDYKLQINSWAEEEDKFRQIGLITAEQKAVVISANFLSTGFSDTVMLGASDTYTPVLFDASGNKLGQCTYVEPFTVGSGFLEGIWVDGRPANEFNRFAQVPKDFGVPVYMYAAVDKKIDDYRLAFLPSQTYYDMGYPNPSAYVPSTQTLLDPNVLIMRGEVDHSRGLVPADFPIGAVGDIGAGKNFEFKLGGAVSFDHPNIGHCQGVEVTIKNISNYIYTFQDADLFDVLVYAKDGTVALTRNVFYTGVSDIKFIPGQTGSYLLQFDQEHSTIDSPSVSYTGFGIHDLEGAVCAKRFQEVSAAWTIGSATPIDLSAYRLY